MFSISIPACVMHADRCPVSITAMSIQLIRLSSTFKINPIPAVQAICAQIWWKWANFWKYLCLTSRSIVIIFCLFSPFCFQWAVETGRYHMFRLFIMPLTIRTFWLVRPQKVASYSFTEILFSGETEFRLDLHLCLVFFQLLFASEGEEICRSMQQSQ